MAKARTVPQFGTHNYESTVTLRLNDWLVDRIDEMRLELMNHGEPTSRSQVIRSLLEKAIEDHWAAVGDEDEG